MKPATIIRQLRALLARLCQEDFSSTAEDRAIDDAIIYI